MYGSLASRIEEYAVRVLEQPSRGANRLTRRRLDCASVPAGPREVPGLAVIKVTVLVGKDQEVVPECDKQIAELLALLHEDIGKTPEAQERPTGELSKIGF